MVPGIDPTVDYIFKRLVGSEGTTPILCDLLNDVLAFPLTKQVREVRLLNPFSEKEFTEEKVSILDVRAEDLQGRRFNLEMETQPLWVFRQRSLYYWARMHGSQLFEGEDYWTIRPTYSICFLGGTLFDDTDYHHTFRLIDADHGGETLCKDLQMHFLELPKYDLAAEEVQTGLERWCYFFKHGATLDSEHMPASLDTPTIRQAMEVLIMFSQDEIERERYLDRIRAKQTEATWRNVEGARKSGFEEGEDVGLKKGLIRQIQAFQRVLKQEQSSPEELDRLSFGELARRAEKLEHQATSAPNGSSS